MVEHSSLFWSTVIDKERKLNNLDTRKGFINIRAVPEEMELAR
jgi:hypothetical protein